MNQFREIVNGAAHFEIGAPLTRAQCEAALESLQAQAGPFKEALTEFDLLATYPLGDGWRYLTATEDLVEGDEVLCSRGWMPYNLRNCVAGPKVAGTHARRRVAEAGWRFVAAGELLQEGDEFCHSPVTKWVPAIQRGVLLADWFGQYRRKLPAPAEPEYRALVLGDTVQDGDETLEQSTGTWVPTIAIGRVLNGPFMPQYRRPVVAAAEPDTGYRMLVVGEVIQRGDQFFSNHSKRWVPTCNAGWEIDSEMVDHYRRPLNPTHFSNSSFSLSVCL